MREDGPERDRRHYLVVLSDATALAWVLQEKRMAFPLARKKVLDEVAVGDLLYLYTARGCFGNPDRDRSRIIARARVCRPVTELAEPVLVGRRHFHFACDLDINEVAPPRQGLEVAPLIEALRTFPNKQTWSVKLRQPPVRLVDGDAEVLQEHLGRLLEPLGKHLGGYAALGALRT